MCKHIHLVADVQPESQCQQESSKRVESTQHSYSPLLHALQQGKCSNISLVREKVSRTLSTLTAQVTQCDGVEGLLAAEKHLLSAKTSCGMISSSFNLTRFQGKRIEPANKNIIPQRPFVSTRSRPKKPTIKLGKPSTKVKELIQTTLFAKKNSCTTPHISARLRIQGNPFQVRIHVQNYTHVDILGYSKTYGSVDTDSLYLTRDINVVL